ncbi:hypothetical protein GCM10011415_33080 [Salipiger pallidus]|uniref:DNA primase n=1 Tax=Salipiger pallidus TaxID=1775170 RepID=A0A8J2ZML8_9RHOB|nr:DNA primase [Salipiger pallidus]GGG80986.1 hypothetical protein GCM10011415_33080 [Salipiger pallidus]
MSLPPGFLDELRNRTSLAQVVGRKVMWDNRKSNQAKGDLWAPCPFHQEKSASFHVDDRKGFYYCFGCQAKGDAISFVRESENVEFMEAVEILAREAGMTMPARDPEAAKKASRRDQLSEVTEQALRWFRIQLRSNNAGDARAYLDRRGLGEDARDRFELGFAPAGWQNLREHLRGQGVPEELILAAGLARKSDKGRDPYDIFRNRIMFPIRDARGRAIAFGGRAMDPNDNAKYLNSPETELFDKGRNLYNLAPAREAAGKGAPLVMAEGYMDVIALSEAGFGAAVAPLGTAVTENQLQLLWRIADEPMVALDGDKAGLRAAYRVIDLALPLLQAGKSLRFALMPEGKDPDDLLRSEGPEAVSRVLREALPMVKVLWRRETEDKVFDSPERKAALDARLRDVIRQIRDRSIRGHYGAEIRDLRWELFRAGRPQPEGGYDDFSFRDPPREAPDPHASAPYQDSYAAPGLMPDHGFHEAAPAPYQGGYEDRSYDDRGFGGYDDGGQGARGGSFDGPYKGRRGQRGGQKGRRPWGAPPPPSASAKASLLASQGEAAEIHLRECVVLAVLLETPVLIAEFEARIESMGCDDRNHAALRDALLRHAEAGAAMKDRIAEQIGPDALETVLSARHLHVVPCLRRPDTDLARLTVMDYLDRIEAAQGRLLEVNEAEADITELADEVLTERLKLANETYERVQRGSSEDKTEFHKAPNGVELDREERSAFEALMQQIRFSKHGN